MQRLSTLLTEMASRGLSPDNLFRDVVETASVGIAVLDLKGRIEYANPAYCELSGHGAAELHDRALASLVHPDEQSDIAFQLSSLLHADKETLRLEVRILRKDGSRRLVRVSGSLLRDESAHPQAAIVMVEDLAPQHVTEDALNEIGADRAQWMEAIPQMAWMTGSAGEPEYVNERWRSFTGRERDAGADLIHPEDRELTATMFINALRSKRPYEVEHRMRRADGSYRWLLARAQPLFDAKGKVAHWFGTSTDIDDRKAAETLLLRTEKLAAAGRLAATVAHEINNPLEAVGNLIYLALHEPDLPPVSRGYLRMANEELRRVGHIVSQTLGFYRESSTPQSVDLSALVNDVLALYQRKLDARQIRVTRNMESVIVEGVAGELRQVVANLMSNALDAMEPYGVLAVEVRLQREQVRLSISDTGHGIAAPLLEHIFEPFFTTKKDAGTGLGLWVVKGIVEKHRGQLEVMSSQKEEDHGTAFVMTLPRGDAIRKTA